MCAPDGGFADTTPTPHCSQEFEYYLSTFSQHGFAHPLNYYRTRNHNFDDEQADQLPPFPSQIPTLQFPLGREYVLTKDVCLDDKVLAAFPGGNLEIQVLEEADHWVLQDEALREDVTGRLVEFMRRVLDGKWEKPGKLEK